ncbi:MAG: hypothetical protein BWY31_01858 [Lentisphaerae bacterium ADurb.Bin242]|nr:MAG: hypothetical protein BWY31_01858 [Lentisphaerae bacterium ADurb.Bin242]
MKNRISLLLLPVLAFGLSDLTAKDTAADVSSATPAATTKKTTIVNTDNPFAAQQKKIEDLQKSLKGSKQRNKKSIEDKLVKEQDALKKQLSDATATLTKKAGDLQSKLTLYKEKNSSKADSTQKELDKTQAEIKRLEELAAVDKWCTASKDASTNQDKKIDVKKSSDKKRKKSS